MEFIRQLCDNFDENEIDPYDDESIDGHYECEQAENMLLNAISHPAISKDLKKHIIEEVKSLSNRDVADYHLIDLNDLKLEVTRRALSNEEGLRLLDEQIQSQKGNYNQHVYVERKIALLRQMGRDADADKEEQKYIRLHEIRKIVVDRLVEQKQYDKAAEYAKAGIGLDNGREIRWADTMWTMRLLEIYELQDNKPRSDKTATLTTQAQIIACFAPLRERKSAVCQETRQTSLSPQYSAHWINVLSLQPIVYDNPLKR